MHCHLVNLSPTAPFWLTASQTLDILLLFLLRSSTRMLGDLCTFDILLLFFIENKRVAKVRSLAPYCNLRGLRPPPLKQKRSTSPVYSGHFPSKLCNCVIFVGLIIRICICIPSHYMHVKQHSTTPHCPGQCSPICVLCSLEKVNVS